MAERVDLIVRGGTIVDGSGGIPREADLLVHSGRIVAIESRTTMAGIDEIDARGRIVTPGFVDPHTHYDGQATWDDQLAPSSLHGVTTAIMGNCGVGFAPCRPHERDLLIRLMEGVEDIPEIVLNQGIPWNWESFPDYLDALDARRYTLDLGAYLPHAALRIYAMGDRASRHEPANAADLASMDGLVREAIKAGALGVGTSRTIFHRASDGSSVPTLHATERELETLGSAIVAAGGGILQYAVDWDEAGETFALLRRVLERTGCPAAVSLVQQNEHPDTWRRILSLAADANDSGLPLSVQVMPRAIGMLLSHRLTLNPFCTTDSYKTIAGMPPEHRLAELARPELRARILAEASDPNPTNLLATFVRDFERMYPLGDPPNYEPKRHQSIAAEARRRGITPEALAYDLLLENGGKPMLFVATVNYAGHSLDATLEMLKHRDTIPGLGDGGAHLGVMCDASYPSFMLTHWARDRDGERLPLPHVVQALSAAPARALGLTDRGLLRPGLRADINVIDFDHLQLQAPRVVNDLPAGGRRIIQRATGYDATIVAGVATLRNGALTGATPGRLLRRPQA